MGEIGNLWVTIGAHTDGLQKGLSQAKTGMQEVKSKSGMLTDALRGVATVTAVVGAVTVALKGAYDATAGATLKYSDQVRELVRLSGVSTEESSRMIQMADDLQVSYESLSASLKFAARQGITPTTDALAKMSDEYLKLNPGAERAAFVFKNFGRAGSEMSKVLEQGGAKLRAMSAEQSRNLILTEKQVQAARKLQIAQDGLNDSWTAWKMNIGTTIIPALGEQLELSNKAYQIQQQMQEDSGKPMRWQTAYAEAYKELQALDMSKFDDSAKADMPDFLKNIIGGAQDAQTELEGVKLGIIDLTMAGMGQETLGNLQTALSEGKITQEDYNAAAEYTMRTLLGMSDTEISGFEKVAGLNADLANGVAGAWDYAEGMQEVYKWLAEIKGLGRIQIPLATGGNIGKQKGGAQEGYGGASGGSFIVPAGYLGDTYAVRASSGEKVTVETNGGKAGGKGGITINGPVTFLVPQGVTTARQLFQSFQENVAP